MFGCDPDSSTAYARRLHQAVSSTPVEVAGRVLAVSASVGVVPIDQGMEVRDAIAASSQACAEAKTKGPQPGRPHGQAGLGAEGLPGGTEVQENLEDKLNSQRFFLEFQPIISLALCLRNPQLRGPHTMRGEDGGTILPGRFIQAAERNGQVSLIDRWVLLKTLHWLNDNEAHLKRLDYATINLSGASLNDARFVDNIFSILSDFPTS
jgi:predicted signal transduction protein with EAL and GGDEF domain